MHTINCPRIENETRQTVEFEDGEWMRMLVKHIMFFAYALEITAVSQVIRNNLAAATCHEI